MIRYNIYATLLDGFQDYLNSSEIYQEYWGFSENPSKTEEEFETEQFQGLIDRINRVPFDSEAADKGTAFNEVIDCIIEHRKSEKMELSKDEFSINVVYKERQFSFPLQQTQSFASQYKGAVCQLFTSGTLTTKYGDVCLYGYIDELMPLSAHDIKTTSKYKAFKFRNGWQKIVYPFCLQSQGSDVSDFFYDVVRFKDNQNNFDTFREFYAYCPKRDIKLLTDHVERLIEFVELNRCLITDLKIFNLHDTTF
jgi:hypothetical protein